MASPRRRSKTRATTSLLSDMITPSPLFVPIFRGLFVDVLTPIKSSARKPKKNAGASFQQHIDVDLKCRVVRVFHVVHIFFNERILGVDALLVEVGGDRIVGGVDIRVRPKMLKTHRLARRRLTNLNRIREACLALGRRIQWVSRVIPEAGVVGLNEHRKRPTRRLYARLVHLLLDETQRSENRAVDF